MFVASLFPADVLKEVTDLRRRLVATKLTRLNARDIELLFPRGSFCRPDWIMAEALDVEETVREIFDLSHDVARAEDELELRARPN
jgi:hypothetical protein